MERGRREREEGREGGRKEKKDYEGEEKNEREEPEMGNWEERSLSKESAMPGRFRASEERSR